MKYVSGFLVVMSILVLMLAGCGGTEPAAVEEANVSSVSVGTANGLDGANVLALGTLKLEGTDSAVTPAQAALMLPLWQVIQSGSLQGGAETEAVVRQIEGLMTEAQLAAIEGMDLTREDLETWMQEQGIEMAAAPGGQGAGALGDMSEDERAKLREEMQNMTDEQRATRMAEIGIQRPEGAPEGGSTGGFRGGPSALLAPLIALLTERAA